MINLKVIRKALKSLRWRHRVMDNTVIMGIATDNWLDRDGDSGIVLHIEPGPLKHKKKAEAADEHVVVRAPAARSFSNATPSIKRRLRQLIEEQQTKHDDIQLNLGRSSWELSAHVLVDAKEGNLKPSELRKACQRLVEFFDTLEDLIEEQVRLDKPLVIDLPPVLIDVESVEGEDVVTCKEVVDLPREELIERTERFKTWQGDLA